jgi:hypothetical protein
MKANDFLQIIELGKTFRDKPKRKSPRKKEPCWDDIDITMLLHKKLQEAHDLEQMLKDREKAHKEEKKEEKKHEPKLSTAAVAAVFLASFPIIAPLYVAFMKHLLN